MFPMLVLNSTNLPTSASKTAVIIGVSYCSWSELHRIVLLYITCLFLLTALFYSLALGTFNMLHLLFFFINFCSPGFWFCDLICYIKKFWTTVFPGQWVKVMSLSSWQWSWFVSLFFYTSRFRWVLHCYFVLKDRELNYRRVFLHVPRLLSALDFPYMRNIFTFLTVSHWFFLTILCLWTGKLIQKGRGWG